MSWPATNANKCGHGRGNSSHLIRVEDKIEDGHYVIRAEMPGLDPDKDVKITVEDNTLVPTPTRAGGPSAGA